ncbi:hypothetical protein JCM5805K_0778 [Lactococcus lactis subsp. lactis]|uniref:Uncharacterized protein n=1 Tax=Lactococcus lactis subsp. lactis TaxID=1360 RepID=A0A0B8QMA5_LACLL|nr:hypothetical protein JCM5805K_0778 [Lactococcus lactis subsp. lactis]
MIPTNTKTRNPAVKGSKVTPLNVLPIMYQKMI